MNIEELFRSQFGPESARQLAQVLGLDEDTAAWLLDRVVRSQTEAVAQTARSDAGRANILDAIANLPQFRDVAQALTEQGGADSLQLAGELLSQPLLGDDQRDLAGQLSRVEGVPQASIQRLMNMSLPLLISFLGQAGVNARTVTQTMATIRGLDLRPRAASGSYVSRAAAAGPLANAPQFTDKGPDKSQERGQAPAGEIKKSEAPSAHSNTEPVSLAQPQPAAPAQAALTPAASSTAERGAQAPQPQIQTQPPASHQPEMAQDTAYSKDSVVTALLEEVAPEPVKPEPVKPEPVQPAPKEAKPEKRGGSAAALAAAAAAAGVGAGAVQPAAPQAAAPARPAGSPWKSATPVVMGSQPSQARPSAAPPAGPRAVPVEAKPAAPHGPQAVPVAPVQPQPVQAQPPQVQAAPTAGTQALDTESLDTEGLDTEGLLSFFREQFAAPQAGALARAVGFAEGDAAPAVQGTAAVLLSALSQKGRTPEGAAELLTLGRDFERAATPDGGLNAALLSSPAELGAMEVRGLSVLDRIFDHPSQVSGRLGTALGTSGDQAGRLLALLTPFVLGLLGRRAAGTGADAEALSHALSGINAASLEGLLPAQLGPLKALLGQQLHGAPPKERATLLETKQAKAGAAAPATSAAEPLQPMTPEPPRPAAPAQPQPDGHISFPWWLLALLALAGIGWYLYEHSRPADPVQTPPAQTEPAQSTPATDSPDSTDSTVPAAPGNAEGTAAPSSAAENGTYTITAPAAGEPITTAGFTVRGKAQPDTDYDLLEDGVPSSSFHSGADGSWEAEVKPSGAGEHTYSLKDSSGTELVSQTFTVTE